MGWARGALRAPFQRASVVETRSSRATTLQRALLATPPAQAACCAEPRLSSLPASPPAAADAAPGAPAPAPAAPGRKARQRRPPAKGPQGGARPAGALQLQISAATSTHALAGVLSHASRRALSPISVTHAFSAFAKLWREKQERADQHNKKRTNTDRRRDLEGVMPELQRVFAAVASQMDLRGCAQAAASLARSDVPWPMAQPVVQAAVARGMTFVLEDLRQNGDAASRAASNAQASTSDTAAVSAPEVIMLLQAVADYSQDFFPADWLATASAYLSHNTSRLTAHEVANALRALATLQEKRRCELDGDVLQQLLAHAVALAGGDTPPSPGVPGFTPIEVAMTLYSCAAMTPPQPAFALRFAELTLPPMLATMPTTQLLLVVESLAKYAARAPEVFRQPPDAADDGNGGDGDNGASVAVSRHDVDEIALALLGGASGTYEGGDDDDDDDGADRGGGDATVAAARPDIPADLVALSTGVAAAKSRPGRARGRRPPAVVFSVVAEVCRRRSALRPPEVAQCVAAASRLDVPWKTVRSLVEQGLHPSAVVEVVRECSVALCVRLLMGLARMGLPAERVRHVIAAVLARLQAAGERSKTALTAQDITNTVWAIGLMRGGDSEFTHPLSVLWTWALQPARSGDLSPSQSVQLLAGAGFLQGHLSYQSKLSSRLATRTVVQALPQLPTFSMAEVAAFILAAGRLRLAPAARAAVLVALEQVVSAKRVAQLRPEALADLLQGVAYLVTLPTTFPTTVGRGVRHTQSLPPPPPTALPPTAVPMLVTARVAAVLDHGRLAAFPVTALTRVVWSLGELELPASVAVPPLYVICGMLEPQLPRIAPSQVAEVVVGLSHFMTEMRLPEAFVAALLSRLAAASHTLAGDWVVAVARALPAFKPTPHNLRSRLEDALEARAAVLVPKLDVWDAALLLRFIALYRAQGRGPEVRPVGRVLREAVHAHIQVIWDSLSEKEKRPARAMCAHARVPPPPESPSQRAARRVGGAVAATQE